jgi:hypothetical protein
MDTISFDVEEYTSEVSTRRFRWRLNEAGQVGVASPESFATKREAVRAGEVAVQRALQKGRLG